MRPKWEDAPEWANYLTFDAIGWRWWEEKPVMYRETAIYWGNGRYITLKPCKEDAFMEARNGKTTTECAGA